MNIRQFFLIVSIALIAACPVHAQKEDNKQAPILVRVNLSVRNTAGGNVNDVKKEDVKIFEDGVEQKVTEFLKQDSKLKLGVIVDNTGSMRTNLGLISDTAKVLLSGLSEKTDTFIVRFVTSANIGLLHDWSTDKASLVKSLDMMQIEPGQSAVIDALDRAADHMRKRATAGKGERPVMVLISDCEDRDSLHNSKEILDKLQASGIQVFVLAYIGQLPTAGGFTPASPKANAENFAKELAKTTGGVAYFPSEKKTSQKDIDDLLRPLLTDLEPQYVVNYSSSNTKRKDRSRKIRIEIAPGEKGEARTPIFREKFELPKD